MKKIRTAGFMLIALVALLLVVSSCASQQYAGRRYGHPGGCNCPKF